MDKKDMRILSILSTNSRETLRNIAKEVLLSKDAVKYRINKLMSSGVISRSRAVVDLSGFKLKKYDILLRFSDEREFKKALGFFAKEKRVTWIGGLFGTYDLRIK
jgi:DNA-binding Lrp family transcriptional regulator